MGVVAICVALAAWKIIAQLTRYEVNEDSRRNSNDSNSAQASRNKKVLCPLCVKRVNERSWRNGRHRTKCARKYEAKINDWPVLDPAVTCPICSKSLRKMSASRLFRCSLCPSDSPVQIGCFLCDFNLCQACVNHQRAQQLIEVVEINQTTSTTSTAENTNRRSFVPPKANPYEFEPSAPAYDAVVDQTLDMEYLPSYEEAVKYEKE